MRELRPAGTRHGFQHVTGTLAVGWQTPVPLPQLHPLLVHVCLSGQSYAEQLAETARAASAA